MKRVHAGLIIALAIILAAIMTVSAFAAYAHVSNTNVIVPHVSVAGISLAGMDTLAATTTLQKAFDDMISAGIMVEVNDDSKNIPLFQTGNGNDIAYNLLEWDPGAAVTEALRVGHNDNVILDGLFTLYYEILGKQSYAAVVTVNEDRLLETILSAFPDELIAAEQTDFSISISRSKGIVVTVVPGAEGQTIDLGTIAQTLKTDARDLQLKTVSLSTAPTSPNISAEDAEKLIDDAKATVTNAPYTVTGLNESGETQTWTISQKNIATWIRPAMNTEGDLFVEIDPEAILDFLTDLHDAIDSPAQNARFTIDGGKVSEFQSSTNGIVVDDETFYSALNSALGTDTSVLPIVIPTVVDLPSVTTQNVNSIGITEILGEATTTYTTSSTSRRANIKHGAEKLNGLLIAPGETVSLISHLKPFTIADGYLPELVIKGDEIKPEVGGGLCQIGTTAFRAVMNSGLEVVERRNHSLAVSYYNDPTNGNPGTDATIYDPAPDFKFRNDMPTYILLITNADSIKGEVTFTFWGTNDGREASYDPPTVLTRTGAGATEYKETADLAPGVQECQHGYTGYTTTFNYTVKYGNGTEVVTPYLSSYRALPQICLVGKAAELSVESTNILLTIDE